MIHISNTYLYWFNSIVIVTIVVLYVMANLRCFA